MRHLVVKIEGIHQHNLEIEEIIWIGYDAITLQILHVLTRNKTACPAQKFIGCRGSAGIVLKQEMH